MPLSALANRYEQFILDLDGCVWVGDEATGGAPQAIGALREAGKRVAFVTNDPRRATEDYVAKLWSLGVQASVDDVVTVGGATQRLLHETHSGSTAFVIGTESMRRHVAEAGLRVLNGTDLAAGAQVVVVAGTDHLGLDDLRIATLALRRGGDLVATSRDPTYPSADGLVPGTGALLAAVEYASGVTATIVGKPEPELDLTALDRPRDIDELAHRDRLRPIGPQLPDPLLAERAELPLEGDAGHSKGVTMTSEMRTPWIVSNRPSCRRSC